MESRGNHRRSEMMKLPGFTAENSSSSHDAVPVRDKSSAELARDSSFPATNSRGDGAVAVVVAVPAGVLPDREPLETLLLLEYAPCGLPAVADRMFTGGEDESSSLQRGSIAVPEHRAVSGERDWTPG
jgi:hypothetical protein